MGKRELEIERECLRWLNENGFFAFKLKNVGLYDKRAGAYRRLSPFEVRGLPDSCAFAPNGTTLWIEYKSDTGRQSEHQALFQKQVEKYNGIYLLARSKEELENELRIRNLL